MNSKNFYLPLMTLLVSISQVFVKAQAKNHE